MAAHLQTYDAGTSTSAFEYFKYRDDGYPPAPLTPLGVYDYKVRGYTGYRFVFENAQDTVSLEHYPSAADPLAAVYNMPLGELLAGGTTNRVMLGNPLMCHIDFARIYANNSDVIEDYYYIFNGDSEAFESYTSGDIAPLQGFIVVVKPTRPRDYLRLPLEGTYAIVSQHGWNYNGGTTPKPPLPKPRTAQASAGRIDVVAATPFPADFAEVAAADSIRVTASIRFDGGASIPKITFPEGLENKAELFIVSPDETQINAVQSVSGQPGSLRIGLESKYAGEIALSFRFSGETVKKAVLLDRALGVQIPVENGSVYRFVHRKDRYESGFEGLDSERFELWPQYASGDGIESSSLRLSVSVQDGELQAVANETIARIEVANAAGAAVLRAVNINSCSYRHALNVAPGVYPVKITLADGRQEIRKVLITK